MEEEIIIVVKPKQQSALMAADSTSSATVQTFTSRADAIAFLAAEAADDRA